MSLETRDEHEPDEISMLHPSMSHSSTAESIAWRIVDPFQLEDQTMWQVNSGSVFVVRGMSIALHLFQTSDQVLEILDLILL